MTLKKGKLGRLTLQACESHKAEVWYWSKVRQIGQWDRIERVELDPLIYGHLLFNTESNVTPQRKKSVFNR